MNQIKPYSESCEQNKKPILEVLNNIFPHTQRILEIGSGTGQHAVYFAQALPMLTWQTSDMIENHVGIQQWLNEAGLNNIEPPIELHVSKTQWNTIGQYDGVFSANTVHIMSWEDVIDMFNGIAGILSSGGHFCLYGPFNYAGEYTSQSNANFDQWLKNRDPQSGIKDFEALQTLAFNTGLELKQDIAMPANNRILVWVRQN